MTYTPDYILELKDGKKVELLFNTRTYRKLSEKKGIELDQLYEQIHALLTKGKTVALGDIPALLLAGHESYCVYNNLPFDATELDADLWVDNVGGMVSGIAAFQTLYATFLSKLLNIDASALETETVEKKSTGKVKKIA